MNNAPLSELGNQSTTSMNVSNSAYSTNNSAYTSNNSSNNTLSSKNTISSGAGGAGGSGGRPFMLPPTAIQPQPAVPQPALPQPALPQPALPQGPLAQPAVSLQLQGPLTQHQEAKALLRSLLRKKRVGDTILFQGVLLRLYSTENGHFYLKKIGNLEGKENFKGFENLAKRVENFTTQEGKAFRKDNLNCNVKARSRSTDNPEMATDESRVTHPDETQAQVQNNNNPNNLINNAAQPPLDNDNANMNLPIQNGNNLEMPPEEDLLTLSLKLSFLLLLLSNEENNIMTASLMLVISIYILLYHMGVFSALAKLLFGHWSSTSTSNSASTSAASNSASALSSSSSMILAWRKSAISFGIAFLRSLSPAAHSFQ